MKTILRTAIFALAFSSAIHSGYGAEIVRKSDNPQSPILQSAIIPPGSEIVLLSGVSAPPLDPSKKPGSIADYGDTKTQTINAFKVVKSTLEGLGYSMSDVVRVMAYVAGDPKLGGKMDFAGMNDGYKMFFGTADNKNRTTRTTVQVAALGVPYFLVEFEVTAAKAPK